MNIKVRNYLLREFRLFVMYDVRAIPTYRESTDSIYDSEKFDGITFCGFSRYTIVLVHGFNCSWLVNWSPQHFPLCDIPYFLD